MSLPPLPVHSPGLHDSSFGFFPGVTFPPLVFMVFFNCLTRGGFRRRLRLRFFILSSRHALGFFLPRLSLVYVSPFLGLVDDSFLGGFFFFFYPVTLPPGLVEPLSCTCAFFSSSLKGAALQDFVLFQGFSLRVRASFPSPRLLRVILRSRFFPASLRCVSNSICY